ncbi:hypothetical protein P3X46_029153 [Hevea brasiliensis]|uniref:Uncharacterized protein n=1 Tax=Hevea brasiliensis TaxID=3981 RepID=A0ABQ9KUA4_HEVBR|nr:hypothetical protein P3X46_029153 [Hevea brasiliensis]
MATLHHQIIYRLQDHAVDLSQPSVSNDALLVLADTETTPTIVQIPRQLPRNELEQLIPKDWLTNYERLHSTSQPIQITESSFRRNPDGTVQTSFQPPRHSTESLPVFQTMMVQPLEKEQDDYPIGAVTPDNHYIYPQKIDGHCPWDLPGSGACDEDCDCRDNYWENEYDHSLSDKNWRKLTKQTRRASCKPQQERNYPPLKPVSSPQTSLPLVQPCMMFSPSSYEADFPSLAQQTDQQTKISTRPFIHSTKVDSEGQTTPITQAEEVLNWQTKNAAVQNKALQRINSKIDQVLHQPQILPVALQALQGLLKTPMLRSLMMNQF